MRLGLIARADNRGLGQQTWAVQRNLQPAKTMVVDCPSMQPLQLHLDRFKLEGLQGFHRLGAMGPDAGGAVNAKKSDAWKHAEFELDWFSCARVAPSIGPSPGVAYC